MFKPKYRFTHEEIRIIVMALVELKNSLIAETMSAGLIQGQQDNNLQTL